MSRGASVIVVAGGFLCIAFGTPALRHLLARNVAAVILMRGTDMAEYHFKNDLDCMPSNRIAQLNAAHHRAWNAGDHAECVRIIQRLRQLGVGSQYHNRSSDDLELEIEAQAQGITITELLKSKV